MYFTAALQFFRQTCRPHLDCIEHCCCCCCCCCVLSICFQLMATQTSYNWMTSKRSSGCSFFLFHQSIPYLVFLFSYYLPLFQVLLPFLVHLAKIWQPQFNHFWFLRVFGFDLIQHSLVFLFAAYVFSWWMDNRSLNFPLGAIFPSQNHPSQLGN